jgi:CO/xanthine dehydrogenase Mo-binding subunit
VALGAGIVDIGQGSDTALSQICAEALQIPIEHVSFAGPDSDSSPYDWKTAASRITYMGGRACVMAADEVKRKLFAHAEDMLECSAEDLELRPGGVVGIKGVPDRAVTFAAIAGRSTYGTGGPIVGKGELMFEDDPIDPAIARASGLAFAKIGTYSFGAHAVEAEIDQVTGQVRVIGAWCAHDVGRAINPAMVEGQIVGGFVQGMGYALFEELVWEGGVLINPTMMDYKIPGTMETPPVAAIIVEEPEPTGPFGAKGVGEPPLVAVAPAIANAVAATGTRVRRIPMTMERVLDALEGEA